MASSANHPMTNQSTVQSIMLPIDQPDSVRSGEELPLAPLAVYLQETIPELSGPLTVAQFPRGYSNLTYLLRMGDRELVLRRPPFGANIASAHDMAREYRVLSGLVKVYAKAPHPLAYCDNEAIVGAPFYVMERLTGVVLRAQPPAGVRLTPQLMQELSQAAIDNLAAIHSLDYRAAGLADLGRPAGYVERQIRGWARRYRNAQTDELPDLDRLISWLEQHMPGRIRRRNHP